MTNEDRKMLECAARAAGIEPCRMNDDENALLLIGMQDEWNPLTNDGDAFRLMSMIGMDECVDYVRGAIEAYEIDHEGCREATIRRSITLAAARLGGYEG